MRWPSGVYRRSTSVVVGGPPPRVAIGSAKHSSGIEVHLCHGRLVFPVIEENLLQCRNGAAFEILSTLYLPTDGGCLVLRDQIDQCRCHPRDPSFERERIAAMVQLQPQAFQPGLEHLHWHFLELGTKYDF